MDELIKDWKILSQNKRLKYLSTALWLKWICERINNNKNFLCVVVGDTGSGKSETAIATAELLDSEFSLDKICFRIEDFLKLIQDPKIKKGSCIVLDELGLSAGRRTFYTQVNKDFINLLQEFRHKNLIVFFTVPDMAFIDSGSVRLLHSIWEMAGINFKTGISKVKAKYYKKMPSTDEKPQARFMSYKPINEGKRKIKFIHFMRPSPILRHAYEKKKLAFGEEFYETLLDKYNVSLKEKPPVIYSPLEEKLKLVLTENIQVKPKDMSKVLGLSPTACGKLKIKVLNKMALEAERAKNTATTK